MSWASPAGKQFDEPQLQSQPQSQREYQPREDLSPQRGHKECIKNTELQSKHTFIAMLIYLEKPESIDSFSGGFCQVFASRGTVLSIARLNIIPTRGHLSPTCMVRDKSRISVLIHIFYGVCI